jgi:hypothetical protein
MINYTQQRYENIMRKIDGIKENGQSLVPVSQWDRLYLVIKGTKGFFEEWNWDEIVHILSKPIEGDEALSEKELDEILEKIRVARKDPLFREFYELMKVIDELKPLCSGLQSSND